MQFIYPSLIGGFLLVLLPLLIQLINLMRQRRVEWAAMEFLLQAYRKHRKWIWLKQFLLLLARMAAIAIAVAMLAHLVTRNQWTRFFSDNTTHHLILLDDSFSMSDESGTGSAFDEADRILMQLADYVMAEDSLQKFTLLRFSAAERAFPSVADSTLDESQPVEEDQVAGLFGELADLNAVTVDTEFDVLLAEKRRRFGVAELSVGPAAAMNLASALIRQSAGEKSIVYVLSDFRLKDWQNPQQTLASIRSLEAAGATVNLVRCELGQHGNLAVTELVPAEGIRAAGVPLFIDVTVHNFGTQPATRIPLTIRTADYGNDRLIDDPAKSQAQWSELPNLLIESLGPGESVSRRFQVYFPTAGQHVVSVELPPDPLRADNRRWTVVDLPAAVPVLIVDGDPEGNHAAYLQSVFQPGERVRTGIRPVVQSEAYLRDVQPEVLHDYRAIYLLDVPQLGQLARQNVEDYVESGGGLAVFLGPASNLEFYRDWATSSGTKLPFFPVPPERATVLSATTEDTPDVVPTDHPIFKVLLGEGKMFASAIRIRGYASVADTWEPPAESSVRVLASLRNGQPLVVEQRVGAGRVIAFLTTLSPLWNTWARQPTFPVMVLETQAYLDSRGWSNRSQLTGTPLVTQFETARFLPTVEIALPATSGAEGRLVTVPVARAADPASPLMKVRFPDTSSGATATDTDQSGTYTIWARTFDGELQPQRYALNVDAREGDLVLAPNVELAESLAGTNVQLLAAADLELAADSLAGFGWSQFFMCALVVLLLGEQCLAYSASYHPPAGVKS